MTTPDIATTMHEAMSAENRRRELAAQAPGLGSLVSLPQPPSAAGVGLSDLHMPIVGEGYDSTPGFTAGRSEPAVRHVTDLGADGLLIEPGPDGGAAGDSYVVVSPPSTRPSWWTRLTSKLRHH